MIEQSTSNISNGIKLSIVDDFTGMQQIRDLVNRKVSKAEKPKDEGNRVRPPYLTMFICELVATGLLMFIGCMGCIPNFDNKDLPHHFSGIAFGLTVMMIIQTFGHISGAHLNPAVTIATVLFGYLTPIMGVVYIVAQFIGATLGYGLLKVVSPDEFVPDGFCVTSINEKLNVIQGLAIEIIITTVLILVCCAVWDKRNAKNCDSTPLRFGFIITVISIAAGPFTGASMNTARSFAPLVFGGSWENQWIYLVGPTVAAPIGWGFYKFFFSLPEDSEENKATEEVISLEMDPHLAAKV